MTLELSSALFRLNTALAIAKTSNDYEEVYQCRAYIREIMQHLSLALILP